MGRERIHNMKHDFRFISKHSPQVKSAYSDLMEILSLVHDDLRKQYTFQHKPVGSYSRNMIVGDNGAGKSTFVKLLLRLYDPTEGEIYYKGKNIREYDFDSYQAEFAPVFQDYVLNAFSIRENLIFDYDERNDLIKPSLEKTGMYEKITDISLDRPYSKKFFDDGVELSGGEQQRLVISRAYCKNSEVLILDEPTSAIDPLSERRLFEDILGILGEKTSIMVSHRMSCSKFANRIFVMEHGKLVEQGTHSELMNLNGLYATMYNRQAQYYL